MKIAVVGDASCILELEARCPSATVMSCDSVTAMLNEDADAYFDLEFTKDLERIKTLSRLLPKLVFVNSVVDTLQEIGQPFARVNAWPTFFNRDICELAVTNQSRLPTKQFMELINWKYHIVPDEPGMISARIVAMIINEAYYTTEAGVSTREEIDIAMKLGTNYPYGPFDWANKIGLKNIVSLLTALRKTDERYTISSLLESEAGEKEIGN